MNLRPYQQKGVSKIISLPRCSPMWDMGLGKTAAVVTAVEYLVRAGSVAKVLIVAPKRVALTVWPEEITKWSSELTFSVIVGSPKKRLAAMDQDADVYITNIDNIVWLSKQLGSKWPYDMVVLDESSMAKNHGSERSKALRRVCRHTTRWVNLTGTPASNGVGDLWHQMYLLDQGQRLGATLVAFRTRWFTRVGPVEYNRWEPRPGAAAEIIDAISDICWSLPAEDYLTLPPLTYNNIEVELPGKAMDMYAAFEESYEIALRDGDATSPNAAAAANKCLQIANGAVYLDDTEREWSVVHNAKIDVLRDVLEEAEGNPVLVFYSFQSDRERILAAFKQARHIDDVDLAEWNKGNVPIMLAHPASAGHGLNIQSGGNIMVWFGLPWNLDHKQQADARLHRSGQTRPVIVHQILTKGTKDMDVLERLAGKARDQKEVLDGLVA